MKGIAQQCIKWCAGLSVWIAMSAHAVSWQTAQFEVNLPEGWHVETDYHKTLLAMGNPLGFGPPFLNIDFVPTPTPDRQQAVLERINRYVGELGGKLQQKQCQPNCQAYLAVTPTEMEGESVLSIFVAVITPTMSYYIDYGSIGDEQQSVSWAQNLAQQILSSHRAINARSYHQQAKLTPPAAPLVVAEPELQSEPSSFFDVPEDE
ncbi:hypothetical protein VST7929_00739 [Vibrio stylophorae]|uniref:DUF1795 domain-containing protein n=1 Tax=Vibrio stylophorae TaxID=659351 RepID=A0ABN8DQI2_9VIBR|nr:hypothetical protein [Vibrio stylophorae]CAH0532892.1 hypothetical protein VST7929_00739 [Vibrio stylophorae]